MGYTIPVSLSFSRASMNARGDAIREGREPPPLDITIQWSDQGTEADALRFAKFVFKMHGLEFPFPEKEEMQ